MFCPQCGSTQPDELNFCKSCGANLNSVRTALVSGSPDEKFDWNKTWLAEMMMSGEEKVRRTAQIERRPDKIPEIKRRNEIKAGVITLSTGIGLTIATFSIMQGIIASGAVSAAAIAILSRVWIAGLIPVLVGGALIFNGIFVSKRVKGGDDLPTGGGVNENEPEPVRLEFPSRSETNQLSADVFSVTDETTKHLKNIDDAKKSADLP